MFSVLAGIGFAELWFSALEGRLTFFCFAKRKVSKEKATLGRRRLRRSPALLGRPGGCGTRGFAPQTVLAESPRPACVAQRLSGGPEKRPGSGSCPECYGRAKKMPKIEIPQFGHGWFTGPLGRRRATQVLADKGRGLSEARRAEFRSPRQHRVAQGTGAAGADPGVAFSLATFFWRSKRKYARAASAE